MFPPIHRPFFFDATILSLIRSPVTSRSNCANDSNVERQPTHRRRRIELLRHADKGRPVLIECLDDAREVLERSGQTVNLVNDDDIELL
jgi:hypothetical protein